MNDIASAEKPQMIVTLVHGTFARDALWTDEHGVLGERITDAAGGKVLLSRFQWSGSNSHRARLHAGEALAAHLRELIATYPSAKHHVVGHSHGGNVVMYAMRDKSVADRVSTVVCLATPFITLERRRLGPSVGVLREFPNPLFACICATYLSFGLGTVGTSPWLVPGLIAIGVVFWLARKCATLLADRLTVRLRRRQEELIFRFSLPPLERTPVLVIRAHRDEAAWYLALVDRLANLPYRLWTPRFVFWLAWGWIFLTLPWVLATTHLTIFGAFASELRLSLEETLLTAFGFGLYALAFAVALLVILGLLAQATMGFGERGIVENWLVHIAATPVPPNARNAIARSFVISGAGLRHAVYRDPAVRDTVARWVAEATANHDVRAVVEDAR
jgi:hypothetical protein